MCNCFFIFTHNLQGKKKEMYKIIWKPVRYILSGFVLYPGKNGKGENKTACWLCSPWGPCWGPPPGVAEWQASVVTAFLGEIDLSFYLFFGSSPPLLLKTGDDSVEGEALWLKRGDLSQNRGFGVPTLPLHRGDPVASTT